MCSSSQMPGKDIITGYNDKRTARHSVSGCQSRVALEEHDSHVLWPSKCICPSGGVFNQCMKFWSADCGTGPGFLWVERDLWRRGGCGLSCTCSEEPVFVLCSGKKRQSNISVKTLVFCFWLHLPTAPHARVLHCSCPQNNAAVKLPALTRLPTSPGSKDGLVFIPSLFLRQYSHICCALDELWLAIITPPYHTGCEKSFFFLLVQIPSFVSPKQRCFAEQQQKKYEKPTASHPEVRRTFSVMRSS